MLVGEVVGSQNRVASLRNPEDGRCSRAKALVVAEKRWMKKALEDGCELIVRSDFVTRLVRAEASTEPWNLFRRDSLDPKEMWRWMTAIASLTYGHRSLTGSCGYACV